jgi:hypothetical protein
MHLILGKISLIKRTMRVRDARMCAGARVCGRVRVGACVRPPFNILAFKKDRTRFGLRLWQGGKPEKTLR